MRGLFTGCSFLQGTSTCSIVVLHGQQGDNLHHHGCLQGLQGNPCSVSWITTSLSSRSPPLGAHRALSHTFPPHSSLTVQRFALSYTGFPCGSAVVAAGLSCALQWVGQSLLEPAVSGSGQPRPLLTEAALQPPARAWAPLHSVHLLPLS